NVRDGPFIVDHQNFPRHPSRLPFPESARSSNSHITITASGAQRPGGTGEAGVCGIPAASAGAGREARDTIKTFHIPVNPEVQAKTISALFALLWLILGNPVAAIIIVLLLLYFLNRRFVGLTPSIARPLKRMRQLSQLRAQIGVNPHDHSAKMQLVRLLVEMKRYKSARELLLEMRTNMEHSAEFWSELGACELALGRPDEGERHMERALEINPRVKYGEPYLRLAETFASRDPAKA